MSTSSSVRPTRSRSGSPKHSSQSSSTKRRPLHERSDSQNNSISEPERLSAYDDPVYSTSPFPRLPSQVLLPDQTFIYEDKPTQSPQQTLASRIPVARQTQSRNSQPSRSPARTPPRTPPRTPNRNANRSSLPAGLRRGGASGRSSVRRPENRVSKDIRLNAPHLPPPTAGRSAAPLIEFWERQSTARSDSHRSLSSSGGLSFRTRMSRDMSSLPQSPNPDYESETMQSPIPLPSIAPLGFSYSIDSKRQSQLFHPSHAEPSSTPTDEPILESVETNESAERDNTPPQDTPALYQQTPGQSDLGTEFEPQTPESGFGFARIEYPTPHSTDRPRTGERPRSASAPAAPTDAFLQALLSNGANVQYPVLRKPSAVSLRTDSSSIKTALPAPLRLRRTRKDSNLARDVPYNSMQTRSRTSLRSQATSGSRLRYAESMCSNLSDYSAMEGYDATERPDPEVQIRPTSTWHEEMEDTLPELYSRAPPLKQQRSLIRRHSSTDSRPSSRASAVSSAGSFYHFLNDSVTAWAHIYYRGAARLSLDPPSVVNIGGMPSYPFGPPFSSCQMPPSTPRPQNSTSTLSAPTTSPDSTGYPDQIYVPRKRPRQTLIRPISDDMAIGSVTPQMIRAVERDPSFYQAPKRSLSASTLPTRSQLKVPVDENLPVAKLKAPVDEIGPVQLPKPLVAPSHIYQKHQARQQGAQDSRERPTNQQDHRNQRPIRPSTPINPAIGPPMTPHLSPDKRSRYTLPPWRAPSEETSEKLCGRTNRQIILFVMGFIFPIAWMLAAVLPIPPRPDWHRTLSRQSSGDKERNDLFSDTDVRRFNKARRWRFTNRLMSIFGLCVIVVVIVCAVTATH